jgi:Domain of unknown function (DUF4156)
LNYQERSGRRSGWSWVISSILVAGCSFVDVKPQALKVRILATQEVRSCKHLGRVTATTIAEVGPIPRSQDDVSEEVENLARNHAASMNGDTIVAASPLTKGERTYEVYRCINP